MAPRWNCLCAVCLQLKELEPALKDDADREKFIQKLADIHLDSMSYRSRGSGAATAMLNQRRAIEVHVDRAKTAEEKSKVTESKLAMERVRHRGTREARDSLRERLKKKVEQLQCLQDKVQARNAQQSEAPDTTNTGLATAVSRDRSDGLAEKVQRALGEKERALRIITDQLRDAKALETQKQQALDDQSRRLDTLTAELTSKDQAIGDRDATQANLRSQLNDQVDLVNAKSEECKHVHAKLKEGTTTCHTLRRDLDEQAKETAAKNNELSDMVEQLDENWQSLTQQMHTLALKDDEITELKARVAELESMAESGERARKRPRVSGDVDT